MGILLQPDFSTVSALSSDFTIVQTSGTVSVATDGAINYCRISKTNGTWGEDGLVCKTGYDLWSTYQSCVIYYKYRSSATSNSRISFRNAESLGTTNEHGVQQEGTGSDRFIVIPSGSSQASIFVVDTWFDIKYIVRSDGLKSGYARVADGTDPWDVPHSSWTYMGFEAKADGFDVEGATNYLQFNVASPSGTNTYDFGNLVITDNGKTDKNSQSVLATYEFDDETGITVVETAGTQEVGSDSGENVWSSTGGGSWNTSGFYTDSGWDGGQGIVDFIFDFKRVTTTGGENILLMIVDSASIAYASQTGSQWNNTHEFAFFIGGAAGPNYTGVNFSNSTWYNFLIRIEPDGVGSLWYRTRDGTAAEDLTKSDWTWLSGSGDLTRHFNAFDETVRFALNHNTTDTFYFDNLNVILQESQEVVAFNPSGGSSGRHIRDRRNRLIKK